LSPAKIEAALKLWAPEGMCSLARILVVDDNPTVRHHLRALLEQQSSWQVCDGARTGTEALQRIEEENPPDIILLDFQMPDLTGLDVARKIT
jgi:CheY-like chemotaxis protein